MKYAKFFIFALYPGILGACTDSSAEQMRIVVANDRSATLSPDEQAIVRSAPESLISNPSDALLKAIEGGTGEIHLTDLRVNQGPKSLMAVYQYTRFELEDGRRVQPAVLCAGQFKPIVISECTESLQIQMSTPEYGDVEVNHVSLTRDFAVRILDFISDSELTTDDGEKFSILTVNNIQYNPVDDLFHVFGWADSGADFFVTVRQDEQNNESLFTIVDWSCK